MNIRKHWTPEEDAHLKQLLQTPGKTLSEIAEILNRSETACYARRKRLGLDWQPRPFSKDDPATVTQLVKFKLAGWGHADIATAFGLTQGYISQILSRHGYQRLRPLRCEYKTVPNWETLNGNLPEKFKKPPAWTELEIHTLRKYLKKGWSISRIQREHLPNRTLLGVHVKAKRITRYWQTKEEIEARKAADKQMFGVLWEARNMERNYPVTQFSRKLLCTKHEGDIAPREETHATI